MSTALPAIGTRLSYSGALGTIRFTGPVDGTQGVWLGVEWDDPDRGKHDGVKDGKRYFSCLVPNSGSFIRPAAAINYGVSFLSALTAKYVETVRGTASQEKVVLGSSGGAIEVEAVNLDKIRSKLSRLERLKDVSLDNESVSSANPPGEIARTCPEIRGLDLSKNLISSWEIVASITTELPDLRTLSLNQNRLMPLGTSLSVPKPFQKLEDLQLSATLTTWNECRSLLQYLPSLKAIEFGYNRIRLLSDNDSPWPSHENLQSVNFDSNELYSFTDLHDGLENIPGLKRLMLTSNRFSRIPAPPKGTSNKPIHSPLRSVKHLALAFNLLATWPDIDVLHEWAPGLESLTLAGNPLMTDPTHASYARAFAIVKIPSLTSLDGTWISTRERTDSELLYLTQVGKASFSSGPEKHALHPQWLRLSQKHGVSDTPAAPEVQDTLSNHLIGIHVYHAPTAPPQALTEPVLVAYLTAAGAPTALRALTSMTVRSLRLKLFKACRVPRGQQAEARLWLVMPDGGLVELDEQFANRDLAYWGIEEGARIVLVGG
ncbi:uncharacterized protein BXZ73DRAFT_86099 [Epithele typhae]|uniref:uncharacterized protein n=1 Tax=Epithele typhae TaxID=378194 RepID=UPI00200814C0|nr:uncharacterized protein BXZ73DRAFT_86099 [Epithele typhae]KAH9945843.1 hypothetical protein BXZ73DRAFT_86099 [Epithele typhae]